MSNTRAFLSMIAACEGADYNVLYGGSTFQIGNDHPRKVITAGGYTSTAAGRYQILAGTWDDFIRSRGGAIPFDEAGQDACALWLIDQRKATQDVQAGRLRVAIDKVCRIWASLPGAPYGQPTRSYAYCEQHYLAAGGQIAGSSAEVPTNSPVPIAVPIVKAATTMGATLFLPAILSMIPQLVGAFSKGGKGEANQALAQTVVDVFTAAVPGAVNTQQAVEMAQANPALVSAARQAIVTHPDVIGLLEVGGGIPAARVANANPQQIPFYKNPGFIMACLLSPLIYMVVYKTMWDPTFSEQLKTVVVTAVLSGLLGALTGFYFGSSLSSAKKDDALVAR
jgi:muramidase (phage lysozyme)